jgi:hypothetical protein
MRRTLVIAALVGLAGLWAGVELFRGPQEAIDRGVPGIAFVIPGEYRILELDQASYQVAVEQLLTEVETDLKVAAIFSDQGDRFQILVNTDDDLIEERISGRNGTTWVITWRGPVRERLEWARENGNLETPGLPAPERRNPYH